jgi:hypothetical protein
MTKIINAIAAEGANSSSRFIFEARCRDIDHAVTTNHTLSVCRSNCSPKEEKQSGEVSSQCT